MNGKIDKQGRLFIERSSSFYKIQSCPFDPSGDSGNFCGDWCPQFSEPVSTDTDHLCVDAGYISGEADCVTENRQTKIEICCGKTLYFHKFEDKRSR